MDSKTLKIIHLELGYLPVLILLNVFELAFVNVVCVCVFEFVCVCVFVCLNLCVLKRVIRMAKGNSLRR